MPRYANPDFAPKVHVPELEQHAYNQKPKHGERDALLFRYEGTNLYQWWAKPVNGVFMEPQDEVFRILELP